LVLESPPKESTSWTKCLELKVQTSVDIIVVSIHSPRATKQFKFAFILSLFLGHVDFISGWWATDVRKYNILNLCWHTVHAAIEVMCVHVLKSHCVDPVSFESIPKYIRVTSMCSPCVLFKIMQMDIVRQYSTVVNRVCFCKMEIQ
jgi:hypothetical protein